MLTGWSAPIWWTRQIGFNGEGKPGELTGLFWKNDPRQLPVKSDWDLEAREALRFAQQLSSGRKRSPRDADPIQ